MFIGGVGLLLQPFPKVWVECSRDILIYPLQGEQDKGMFKKKKGTPGGTPFSFSGPWSYGVNGTTTR